jgi:hypothetical protein
MVMVIGPLKNKAEAKAEAKKAADKSARSDAPVAEQPTDSAAEAAE